jgi:hypothetical protein
MLETVREYGYSRLKDAGDEHAVRMRHRDWCVALLEEASAKWLGPDQEDWSSRLRQEYPNLRASFEFCLTHSDQERIGVRMIGHHGWFLWGPVCIFLSDGRHWLDRALAVDLEASPERGEALAAFAYLASMQGDVAAATSSTVECLAIAEALEDQRLRAYATHMLGLAALFTDPPNAVELLSKAVEQYQAAGAEVGIIVGAQHQLGLAYILERKTDLARAQLGPSRDALRGLGASWDYSYAIYGIGLGAAPLE